MPILDKLPKRAEMERYYRDNILIPGDVVAEARAPQGRHWVIATRFFDRTIDRRFELITLLPAYYGGDKLTLRVAMHRKTFITIKEHGQ